MPDSPPPDPLKLLIPLADPERATAEAQPSKDRFRLHFDLLPRPAFMWRWTDGDFLFIACNRAADRVTEGRASTLLGSYASELYAEDHPEIPRDMELCLRRRAPLRREMLYTYRTTRRERRQVADFVFVPPDLVVVHTEDVTDARRAEQALSESRARLARAEAIAHHGSFEVELASGDAFWSDEMFRILGFEPAAFEPTLDRGLESIHPDDADAVRAAFRRAVETGAYDSEARVVRPDGEVRWAHAVGEVVLGEDGRPATLRGSILDVTDRKELELQRQQSEDRLRAVLDHVADGVGLMVDGRIAFANQALCAMLGMAPDAMAGRQVVDFIHPEDRGRAGERIAAILDGAAEYPIEYRLLRADGEPVPVEIYSRRLTVEGKPGLVSIIRDVSERQRREEELRRLASHLQSVREEEQRRIAREIHDVMGQSLTGLKLDLAAVERRLTGESGEHRAGLVADPWLDDLGDRIAAMTEQVDAALEATRRLSLDLRPAILDDLGLEAAVDWHLRDFRRRTGLACHWKIDLPSTPVEPELATAIFRILQESLTNVARHAEADRVIVRLNGSGGGARLEIVDDGRGFSLGELSRELSLGIVSLRERARACGGELTIESAPGAGTRVVARFPP